MQTLHRHRGRWLVHLAASVVVATAVVGTGAPASAAPDGGTLLAAAGPDAVANSYLVVFKPGMLARSATGTTAQRLAAYQDGQVGHVFTTALQGFEATMDEAAARRLAADPAVAYVQQNTIMRFQDSQIDPPNRGLDRIDQPNWPLDNVYTYPTTADDVRVYVIDSGIRATHTDFRGRVDPGIDVVTGGPGTEDCVGHGTHVSGIIGGTRHGVAKRVTIVPVKLVQCEETFDAARVVAALDWVTGHHQSGERAVASLALSGPHNQAVHDAVTRVVGDGVVVTGAAGNNTHNACAYSPGSHPWIVTVAATDFNGSDMLWPSSNLGSCVDVFAPGRIINSAWHTSNIASQEQDGTSASAAFAAGVAAIIWSLWPSASSLAVPDIVEQSATYGMTHTTVNPGQVPYIAGSPRRHLFVPTIVISPLPQGLHYIGDPLNGQTTAYRQLTAAGGTGPYTWSASGLPPNFTLTPGGELGGVFSTSGSWTARITATDAAGRSGSITVLWSARRDVCPTC